jgi:copper chaperone CopZ
MSEHKNCHVDPVEKPVDESLLASAWATYLAVGGMGCPTCALRVRNGLLQLDGVLVADVLLQESIAVAAYDPARALPADLAAAVSSAGNDGRHHYTARILSTVAAAEVIALP